MPPGFLIQRTSYFFKQRILCKIRFSILQIECIVKIRGIFSYIMLDYSFSLIQCFYQTGFRCPAILIFLPEIHKRFLLSIGQQREYPFGSPMFSLIFLGAVRKKRRGDISVIYFTYIVDETHEQGFPRIQLRVVFQHYAGKECQVPGVLCRTF